MTCGRELELKLLKDLPLANWGNSSLSDSDFVPVLLMEKLSHKEDKWLSQVTLLEEIYVN